jgi:pimeloyl-ACP methyl ester carboxylesterase
MGRDRTFAVGGSALHYVEWGDPAQRPLLFLHGGSAHARWWDFVIAELATDHCCIALDLRGHGESAWPADRDYRLATHAEDVAAVVAGLDLRNLVLIGHSFGGFVAMRCAPGLGDRLGALIIVDSRTAIGDRAARLLDALRKLPHPRYPSLAEATRRFRLMPSASSAPPAVLAHVARHGVIRAADGTWIPRFDRRALGHTVPEDLAPALAATACPILAVRGTESRVVSADALARFRVANPAVVTAEIPDAHHHVMLDQPVALARVIRAFLAAHAPP